MLEENQSEIQKNFEKLETHWFSCPRIEYCKICDLVFEAMAKLNEALSQNQSKEVES